MEDGSTGFEAVESATMRQKSVPDFIVIGAMKCATTTLHEQLALQSCLFMSRPKEPNFFSDEANYARGIEWYASFFAGAGDQLLLGESSTHYSMLPTHPHTVERMRSTLPNVKLIYVMRHPIDRLTSHYLHEVTVGNISVGLEEAVQRHPELIDYSRYSMQLEPYLRMYGPESILPIFFDCLVTQPDLELQRIGSFIGAPEPLCWDHAMKPQNIGRERMRKSTLREALVQAPVLRTLRRKLIPRQLAESLKSIWRVGIDPPAVPAGLGDRLRELFDRDLARLGPWLGIKLNCDVFHAVAGARYLSWRQFHVDPCCRHP